MNVLLSNTWIVVRIDGRGFSKLTSKYKFEKPNDRAALDLMNEAAKAVMKELPDLVIAYGNSDEYSKLTTTIVSTFTSYYVFLWSKFLPDRPLTPPLPSFDGRAVCYPSDTNLRDYMSWRQVDCHINNLYNTTFWTLVQKGGMSVQEAEQRLSGTVSADKNEILFQEFGINYNNEPECFKKGTILYRDVDDLRDSRLGESPVFPVFSAQPGPTFLSTASTPSPPSSPPKLPDEGFPNPLRSNPVSPRNTIYPHNTFPISPPSTVTSPMGKQNFTSLTPLPLSPPILKPSSKPPLSLDAPNPTTRANFSPRVAPEGFADSFAERTRPDGMSRTASHSASASMSFSGPSQPKLQRRSPSLSQIHTYLTSSSQNAGPPSIPLRISSIPANTKPRKLSLQHLRSYSNLKAGYADEKENLASPAQDAITPPRNSPPLNTNKELPSPPVGERRVVSDPDKKRGSNGWQEDDHPGIAELPATSVRHSRQQSQPMPSSSEWGSYAHFYDKLQSSVPGSRAGVDEVSQPALPVKDASRSTRHVHPKSEANSEARKSKEMSKSASAKKARASAANKEGSNGRPVQMSRTQKEKDRKKRSKAKVVVAHVDLIKDEFWEKRPWILSGKAG
ncbi:tRNA-His guanylyltransferase [Didymella pomorum]